MIKIIIVILVICMAIGPVMMLRLSPNQKRLANLRQKAVMDGLTVRTLKNPVAGDPKFVTAYGKKWSTFEDFSRVRKQIDAMPVWSLIRHSEPHGLHFKEEWDWQIKPSTGRLAYESRLKTLLDSLPVSIIGVEVTREQCSFYWLERGVKAENETISKEQMLDNLHGILVDFSTDLLKTL